MEANSAAGAGAVGRAGALAALGARPHRPPRRRRLPLLDARAARSSSSSGESPPPADQFDVRRVEFSPGEIRIKVTNPQREDLTIATVTVDDAIVPYTVDGPTTLGRLRSATIVVPYAWVEDEPIAVGITSSTGIQTTEEIAAAVETPEPSPRGFVGYAVIGALVGVLPIALGLLWLPSLRRARPEWLAAFMALTGGLLTFLAVEALTEALELQAALPGALGGTGLVLLGVAASYLALTFLSQRLGRAGAASGGALGGLALATLVAVGIGVHNLGEGLAVGTSFALGELTLGTFLIVGFMLHNVTEGLGIAAPVAEGGAGRARAPAGARPRRRRARRSSAPGSAATSRATSWRSSSSRWPPARRCRSSSRSPASSRGGLPAASVGLRGRRFPRRARRSCTPPGCSSGRNAV